MKILHINGKIIQSVYDKDWFSFENNSNNASIFEIDEISPNNKDICFDLARTISKKDKNGDGKYYIENNELYLRDNWEEHYENIFI